MRKVTVFLTVLCLLAGLTGCGGTAVPESPGVSAAPAETAAPAAEVSAEPVPTAAPEPLPENWQNLELESALAAVPLAEGEWDVVCQSLNGEGRAELSAGHAMVSASLIKLFVMAAVYDRYGADGLPTGVYGDLWSMITVSDNGACNRLVELLGDGDAAAGEEAVNSYAAREGYTETKMLRLMLENNGLQNYTSAADCALLLERIYRGECVSAEASRRMLEMLLGQEVSNGLDALPEGTLCGHKTGNLLFLVCGDCGIITAGDNAWVLCVICNNQTDELLPQESIRGLTAAAYGYLAH